MNDVNQVTIPNRVTLGDIQSQVKSAYYHVVPDTTLTICVLTLNNGYTVMGSSACVDPASFNKAVGEQIAYDNALNEIWALEGYLLKQKRFEAGLV
jgi:hypothetical protein